MWTTITLDSVRILSDDTGDLRVCKHYFLGIYPVKCIANFSNTSEKEIYVMFDLSFGLVLQLKSNIQIVE